MGSQNLNTGVMIRLGLLLSAAVLDWTSTRVGSPILCAHLLISKERSGSGIPGGRPTGFPMISMPTHIWTAQTVSQSYTMVSLKIIRSLSDSLSHVDMYSAPKLILK